MSLGVDAEMFAEERREIQDPFINLHDFVRRQTRGIAVVVDEVVDPRRALDTERVMVAGDTERMFARDVDTHRGIDDTRTRAQWPSPPNATR